jgi:hypothetical protein
MFGNCTDTFLSKNYFAKFKAPKRLPVFTCKVRSFFIVVFLNETLMASALRAWHL